MDQTIGSDADDTEEDPAAQVNGEDDIGGPPAGEPEHDPSQIGFADIGEDGLIGVMEDLPDNDVRIMGMVNSSFRSVAHRVAKNRRALKHNVDPASVDCRHDGLDGSCYCLVSLSSVKLWHLGSEVVNVCIF